MFFATFDTSTARTCNMHIKCVYNRYYLNTRKIFNLQNKCLTLPVLCDFCDKTADLSESFTLYISRMVVLSLEGKKKIVESMT